MHNDNLAKYVVECHTAMQELVNNLEKDFENLFKCSSGMDRAKAHYKIREDIVNIKAGVTAFVMGLGLEIKQQEYEQNKDCHL